MVLKIVKTMNLVLNSFGTALSRDMESFVVSSADGRTRVPTDGVRSIQLGKGTQVTSDAIFLAIEKEIEIFFTDKSGKPKGRVWSPKYGSISTIRKGQVDFCRSQAAVEWIKDILCRKIDNQQALILSLGSDPSRAYAREKTVARLQEYRERIHSAEAETVQDIAASLRGWEGVASRIYFETYSSFLPEQYRFEGRSQHPAMDMANAMLNYAYGMLYSIIEGDLIKAGCDPYVGILHRDEYNRPVLAYDLIEVYRVWADLVVFRLLEQNVVDPDHFSRGDDGSYWLEGLGKRMLIQGMNDYMEEVIPVNGTERSRLVQISLHAQKMAQLFRSSVQK